MKIVVTQADENAASEFFGDAENHPAAVRALQLLLARHRIEALEQAAKVAEDHNTWPWEGAAIAIDIRNLQGEG